jgi:hypothetical protein
MGGCGVASPNEVPLARREGTACTICVGDGRVPAWEAKRIHAGILAMPWQMMNSLVCAHALNPSTGRSH